MLECNVYLLRIVTNFRSYKFIYSWVHRGYYFRPKVTSENGTSININV